MKKYFFSLLAAGVLCTTLPSISHAQTAELENIGEVVSGRIRPVRTGGAVVGYAFVYKLDNSKKGTAYRLQLLDENLKTIGTSDFESDRSATLIDALYEGGTVALVFEDAPQRMGVAPNQYVKTFNVETKATTTVSYERDAEDKNSGLFGRAMAQSTNGLYDQFTTVEGEGFLTIYTSQNKNGGLGIQLIGTDGTRKWRRKLMGTDNARMDARLLGTAGKTILFFGSTRSSIMSRDAKNYLIGLDGATGQQLFRKPLESQGVASEPVFVKTLPDGRALVCNMLSDADENFSSARHTGFNYGYLNQATGELTDVKTIDYSKDLASVLAMKNDTKSEEGFLHISNIIPMPDNSMMIVGEFFRRTVSAGGMAAAVLTGGNSNAAAQGTIGDLFVLRVQPDGAVANLEKVEKAPVRVNAVTGISIGMLGRLMELARVFDYQFTDELEDHRKVVVIDGKLDGNASRTVSAISLHPQKGLKIKNLTPTVENGEEYFAVPAKPGYALLMKRNKRTKRASLQLERLD